ncbi:MAG: hypothetical protein ACE5GT_01105 [Rhodospirillales bacterium]
MIKTIGFFGSSRFATLITTLGPAHAYLDPGSGSMIVQLILGAIAGAGIALKLYWNKIVFFFNRSQDEEIRNDS